MMNHPCGMGQVQCKYLDRFLRVTRASEKYPQECNKAKKLKFRIGISSYIERALQQTLIYFGRRFNNLGIQKSR